MTNQTQRAVMVVLSLTQTSTKTGLLHPNLAST
jgi:hypothetical protein